MKISKGRAYGAHDGGSRSRIARGARCNTAMLLMVLGSGTSPSLLAAQNAQREGDEAGGLDSLVSRALDVNPTVRAARERAEAARARIGPAGALPDPMVGIGIMNLPISSESEEGTPAGPQTPVAASMPSSDMMTMKTLALGQTLPFPGKLGLARRAAELEFAAAGARRRATELQISAEVRRAYYEIAYLDRASEVLANNHKLLVTLIQSTESRYSVGAGEQQDVLKARVETSRIAEEAVTLAEGRRAALARLNALLDRPSDTAVGSPRVPERIASAAVAADVSSIRFASGALGARASDSPLPGLEVLQQRAVQNNPELRTHEAEITAQSARLELAQKAHLPDFDLSLQYGQRDGRSDMVSMMLSVPVPLQKGRKQDQQVTEARGELAALQADHDAMVNEIRADVAEQHALLERGRAQLALFVKAVIPQGRAALESATSAYQVGRADFLTLLENQTTLYNYETAYFRALADFAIDLAELERIVGAEVLP